MKSFKEYLVETSVKDLENLVKEMEKKYKGDLNKVKEDAKFKKLSKDAQKFILSEL